MATRGERMSYVTAWRLRQDAKLMSSVPQMSNLLPRLKENPNLLTSRIGEIDSVTISLQKVMSGKNPDVVETDIPQTVRLKGLLNGRNLPTFGEMERKLQPGEKMRAYGVAASIDDVLRSEHETISEFSKNFPTDDLRRAHATDSTPSRTTTVLLVKGYATFLGKVFNNPAITEAFELAFLETLILRKERNALPAYLYNWAKSYENDTRLSENLRGRIRQLTMRNIYEEFPSNPTNPAYQLEERLRAIVPVINMGPKMILPLLLPPEGEYATSPEIVALFREAFKGSFPANFIDRSIIQYFDFGYIPVGLIAKKYVIDFHGREELVGYGLTEAGEKYGIPAAAVMLYAQKELGFNVFELLGQMQESSGADRAPYVRSRILAFLAKNPGKKMNILEIADAVNSNSSDQVVGKSLAHLKSLGLIEGETIETAEMAHIAAKHPDLWEPRRSDATYEYRALIDACKTLLKKGEVVSRKTLEEYLDMHDPNARRSFEQKKLKRSFSEYIVNQLDIFRDDLQILKFADPEFGGKDQHSWYEVNILGEMVYEQLLKPLELLLHDTPEGAQERERVRREILPVVLQNIHAYAMDAAKRYEPFTPTVRAENRINFSMAIQNMLIDFDPLKNPNGVTTRMIRESFGTQGPSINTIRRLLNELPPELERDGRTYRIENYRTKTEIYFKYVEVMSS